MKDLSGVADWWWESTLREANCYYEQWKSSTPLQRIQICPKLPDDLCEHRFQRTEQRGVQLLLKAIPEAEQQSLVTDRALSSTAILYKLLIRFQPGGAGEKQISTTIDNSPKGDERQGLGCGFAQLAQTLWEGKGSQCHLAGWCFASESIGWAHSTTWGHGSTSSLQASSEPHAAWSG
jgi:hypothetical protein